MVELNKRKNMEKYIDFFINNMCKEYPFYMDNLSNNIDTSELFIVFYNSLDIPLTYNYKNDIYINESIDIVCEILESISENLKYRFLLEIEKGNIVFDEDISSYLEFENGKYIISIKDNENISTSLAMVHEFFHLLHLEQVNYDGENNNYYCYTETLGMSGDLYSFFYLLNSREYLKDDLLAYIHELINRMGIKAKDSLVDGILISIYNEEKSLSKKSIKNYINKYNLSDVYLDLLKSKECAKLDYYDDVRYVYSLSKALVFSYNLYKEEYIRNNFKNIMNDLNKMKYVEWENKYINQYINNEETYLNLVNKLLNKINRLYNKDAKVKKIGEI